VRCQCDGTDALDHCGAAPFFIIPSFGTARRDRLISSSRMHTEIPKNQLGRHATPPQIGAAQETKIVATVAETTLGPRWRSSAGRALPRALVGRSQGAGGQRRGAASARRPGALSSLTPRPILAQHSVSPSGIIRRQRTAFLYPYHPTPPTCGGERPFF
jgi:hypothetical protein